MAILAFLCLRNSGTLQKHGIETAAAGAMALCMLLMCSSQIKDGRVTFYDKREDSSDIANYSQMADHETYAIQGSNYDWPYTSPDCGVLRNGKAEKSDQLEMDIDTELVASIYAYRDAVENQLTVRPYYVSVYDRDGELAARVPEISDPSEHFAGFDVNTPINGISRVEFTYEDGSPAFINKQYQVFYRN